MFGLLSSTPSTLIAIGVAAVSFLASCSEPSSESEGSTDSEPLAVTQGSESEGSTDSEPLAVTQGSESEGSTDWGPLAVSQSRGGGDEAVTEGQLKVTDRCVLLEEATGELVLLVWPSGLTQWSATARAVIFQSSSGSEIELTDGDRLKLVGGDASIREASETKEAFLERVAWESAPSEECVTASRWSVTDVSLITSSES